MSKKALIRKLLEKLSEEDLAELLGDSEETSEEAVVVEQEQEPENKEPSHIHTTNNANHNSRNKNVGKSSGKRSGKKSKRRNSSKGNACRVLPINIDNQRHNKFEDMIAKAGLDPNEQRELDSASEQDEQVRTSKTSFKKMSRNSTLIDVECSACGKEETVSASLVADFDRWKCNSCCCQAG